MNSADILKLVNAGYTKEEIDQMQSGQDQNQDQTQDQTQDQNQDQNQEQEQQPDELKSLRDELNQAMQQIKDLTSQVQKNNLLDRRVEQLPGQDAAKNTDAVIGELIRPTLHERKGL